jgi:hypothetical protein
LSRRVNEKHDLIRLLSRQEGAGTDSREQRAHRSGSPGQKDTGADATRPPTSKAKKPRIAESLQPAIVQDVGCDPAAKEYDGNGRKDGIRGMQCADLGHWGISLTTK